MFVGSPALPFPGLIVIGFYNEKQAAMVPIPVPIGDTQDENGGIPRGFLPRESLTAIQKSRSVEGLGRLDARLEQGDLGLELLVVHASIFVANTHVGAR